MARYKFMRYKFMRPALDLDNLHKLISWRNLLLYGIARVQAHEALIIHCQAMLKLLPIVEARLPITNATAATW